MAKTNTNIASWKAIYEPMLGALLINNKAFLMFGKQKTVNSKGTNGVVKFKYYSRLAAQTSALTEGTTPAALTMTASSASVTPSQLGGRVTITDLELEDNVNDEMEAAVELMGDCASRTMNIIVRNVLNASTNVYRANNVAADANIITAMSADDIRTIVSKLQADNVEEVTEFVKGSPNNDTTPLDASFIAIGHPHVAKDFKGLTGYIAPANYASGAKTKIKGEQGAFDIVRFIQDSECFIDADAGGTAVTNGLIYTTANTACDVYYTYFIGRDAYGKIHLNKDAYELISKGLGEGEDSLNQTASVGFKVRFGAIIVRSERVLIFRSGATA